MKLLFIVFLFSLVLGQIGAVTLFEHIRIYPHELILLILLFLGFLRRPKFKKQFLLSWPIATFTIVGLTALVIQLPRLGFEKIALSSLYLWRWVLYSGIYFLTALNSFNLLSILYLMGVVMGWLGFLQLWLYPNLRNLWYLGWDPHEGRLFSTLLDPNFMGLILVLAFFVGLYLAQDYLKYRLLTILGQVSIFAALILTYSRSSYLAFICGLATYLFLKKKNKLLTSVILVFGLVMLIWPKASRDTLSLWRQETSVARINNWQISWELIKESPFSGYGFNTLRYLPWLNPNDPDSTSHAASGVDSSILFLWLTTGIIGLGVYLWLLGEMWGVGKSLIFRKNALGLTLISSLVAIIVHSFFVNSFFYPWVMIWLWVLVGSAR